eukprot:RCo021047
MLLNLVRPCFGLRARSMLQAHRVLQRVGLSTVAPRTALLYHPVFLEHNAGFMHPESPDRLVEILEQLNKDKLFDKLLHHQPAKALRTTLELVHDPRYVSTVEREIASGRTCLSTGDTNVSAKSWLAALHAAGAGSDAVDMLMAKKARNAFCAVRPPGHHACPDRGMGFCVFNNIAIAARYAQKKHGLPRVLIIDWDYHHGNGTQDAFWSDGTVMVFGTQHRGAYPGSGYDHEQGEGAGHGLIKNFALPEGTGDEEFERIFLEELAPAARNFKPSLILVSAGYDSHKDDPLGCLGLSEQGFARLTQIVVSLADELCDGRLILFLEGGYNTEALAASVSCSISELLKSGGAAGALG